MIFRSYITATIAQSGGSFVAVALLARILNSQEFGRWVLLEPLILLMAQLSIFGTNMGVIKIIAQDKISISQAIYSSMQYIRWIFVFVIIMSGIFIYVFFSKNLTAFYIIFWLLTEGFLALMLGGFRGANEPSAYVISVLIRIGIIVIGLFIFWYTGYTGFALAEDVALWWGVASAVSCIALLIKIVNHYREKKETLVYLPMAAKSGVNYGLPILVAVVLASVIGNGDRYVLSIYTNAETVGHYAMYAKIASALNLMVTPINLWWPTARFVHLDDHDGGAAFFSRATLQMLFLFTFMGTSLWLISPSILSWLAPGVTYSATIVGLLIVAALAVAMSSPLSVGLLKEGNTKWIPVTLLISATLQIGLAIVFVQKWGGDGAAYATAVSSILGLIFQRILSQRFHRYELPYLKIFSVLVWFGFLAYLLSPLQLSPYLKIFTLQIMTLPILYLLKKQLWPLIK